MDFEEIYKDNAEYIRFSDTAKWDNCLSFILNYLFKISTDNSRIFATICREFDTKLNNDDKGLDYSLIDNMKVSMSLVD